MKNKIKKILLTIICILILPIVVKADMGAPESYQYDVVITDKEGIPLVDWDMKEITKIPYDTTITVLYEYSMNGELYADVEYNGKYGYVKLSDTQPLTGELDYSKLEKNTRKIKYYTIKETDMYKGPSVVYGKIEDTTIPKGEEITYTYSTYDDSAPLWILVKYNGVEGWVYSYPYIGMSPYNDLECTLVTLPSNKNKKLLILTGDAKLYKDFNSESEVVGTLKKDGEYAWVYSTTPYPKTTAYYIETKDASGWYLGTSYMGDADTYTVTSNEPFLVLNKNGLSVYNHYDDETTVKGLTIPYLTELTAEYRMLYETPEEEYYSAYKVEYKGKEYWLKPENNEDYEVSYYISNITINKSVKMYSDLYDTSKELDVTIPENTALESKFSIYYENDSWLYVEYNNQKGWIIKDDSMEITDTYIDEIEVSEDEEDKKGTETKSEEKEDEENSSLTPKQIGILCVAAAIILALVAVVTIKLINKKNSKKELSNNEK